MDKLKPASGQSGDAMKQNISTCFTQDRIALFSAWLFSLAFVIYPFFYDSDTYWHLANGREMVNAGRIISEEVFSYTHFGAKFDNHEWLSQVIFYLIWHSLGLYSLFGFKLLVVSLVVLLLYRTIRIVGGHTWLAAVLCVFAVFSGLIRYTERPELFSLLNTALLGFILYGFRANQLSRRLLWFIPLVLVVWDWLHGSVYGLVLLTLFVAGENAKHHLPAIPHAPSLSKDNLAYLNRCFAVTIIAMLLNPFGLLTYGIFFGILGGEGAATSKISEFMPVTWKEFAPYILLFSWAAFLVLRHIRRPDITQLLLLVIFGCAALRYNRVTGAAAITMAPIIASLTMSGMQNSKSLLENKLHHAAVILAATYILSFGYVVKFLNASPQNIGNYYYPASRTAFGYHFNENVYPVGTVHFIKAIGLTGNLYNTGAYGGYLAYHITPERKIFQYNLPIVFGDTARFAEHPDEMIGQDINYAVVSIADSMSPLFPPSNWARIYSDPFAVLLLRRIPQNDELIRQYEIRYFFPGFADDKLRSMSGDSEILPRLTFEMGVYLAHREDERIANIWAEILTVWPNLRKQPQIQQLLEKARKYNNAQALTKLVE